MARTRRSQGLALQLHVGVAAVAASVRITEVVTSREGLVVATESADSDRIPFNVGSLQLKVDVTLHGFDFLRSNTTRSDLH